MVVSERLQQKRLASANDKHTSSPYFSGPSASSASPPLGASSAPQHADKRARLSPGTPATPATGKAAEIKPELGGDSGRAARTTRSSSVKVEAADPPESSPMHVDTQPDPRPDDGAPAGAAPSVKAPESTETRAASRRARKGKAAVKIEYETDEPTDRCCSLEEGLEEGLEQGLKQELKQEIAEEPSVGAKIPEHFLRHVHNIREMRKHRDAPVDTVGCERLADRSSDAETYRYQVLLSLMLSAQTKDEITGRAMRNLIQHGCTVDEILATPVSKIQELIYPVGFHRRKAEYILATTRTLKDKYNGDIPSTLEGLMSLNGVGPKMAHLVMEVGWGKTVGIGVDTHVHRISNRLKWVKKETKTPEDTRKALQEWMPKEYWSEINWLLVGFGQQICKPIGPHCWRCLNVDICAFARKPENRARVRRELAKQATVKDEPADVTSELPGTVTEEAPGVKRENETEAPTAAAAGGDAAGSETKKGKGVKKESKAGV